MKRKDQAIIIIGAGAAGLMAARRLARRYKVVVLEANDRPGGRIHTVTVPGFSRPIEAGAEFIHGDLPLTQKLLKKGDIQYTEVEGNFYRANSSGFQHQEEMIEGWDKLLKQMKKEKNDMTLDEFLQKHFGGQEFGELRKHTRNYAEGFDVADPARASMKALYKEWSGEDHQIYRIPGGYGQLITWLVSECKKLGAEIITDCVVTDVNWQKNKVTVRTKDAGQFNAEKCIITTPVSSLAKTNNDSIDFHPSIDSQIRAANEVGYGTVIKVVIEFDQAFWNSYATNIGFIISDQEIPTWWTQLPDPVPILTGWKGGPGATVLGNKSDENILEIGLNSLSALFKMPVSELQQMMIVSKVFNWVTPQNARGAYSYAYPTSKAAKKVLNKDVDGTIYFAGEALYMKESSGTVEAALISGKEVAAKIRRQG